MNDEIRYTISLRDLFSRKMRDAANEADNLNKKVDDTTKGLNKMSRAAQDANNNMGREFRRFGSRVAGALGIGFGANQIVQFGKSVVDSLVNYEYFSSSLRTLMRGDEQVAQALQTQLISLAKETPFSLVEVQDATKQLLAYGFSAGDVTKNIRMLGDVASALKIPFSDIAYIYGTLKTQGRAYARDIMQFTQRGIPVVKELAKQFNVTEAEVSKMVESGKVGFADIEKAFISMTSQGGMFFNMMQEQAKTTGGRISALGDSWEQLKVNIGKSQKGIIASTVSFFDKMVSTLSQEFARKNYREEALSKSQYPDIGFGFQAGKDAIYLEAMAASAMGREERAAKGRGAAVFSLAQAERKYLDLKRQYKLSQMGLKLNKDEDEITEKQYEQRAAILLKNISNLQGVLKSFGMKAKPEPTAGAGATPTADLSTAGTKASAPKYTQITINVSEMKAADTIEISDAKGTDYRTISDKIMEMMAGALNDSQRMAVH